MNAHRARITKKRCSRLGSIRGADDLAMALRRLLSDKNTSQYGTTYMTAQKAASMVRQAEKLVEGMDQRLRIR